MVEKNILKSKMNIEEMGDYSYELLGEISRLIGNLPDSKFISSNQFIDIKNKLDKAKSLGMNVTKYEDQIYDFRVSLLHRKISNKIEKIKNLCIKDNHNQGLFEISSIENNYIEFKNDYENTEIIDEKFKELVEVITQTKIKFMIEDYINGEGKSGFDFDHIMKEMEIAEQKGVDIKELRMQILGD